VKINPRPRTEEVEFRLLLKGQCFWDLNELYIRTEGGIAFFTDHSTEVNAVRLRDGFLKGYSDNYPITPEYGEEVVFNKD
jgi:hypothetical protein